MAPCENFNSSLQGYLLQVGRTYHIPLLANRESLKIIKSSSQDNNLLQPDLSRREGGEKPSPINSGPKIKLLDLGPILDVLIKADARHADFWKCHG